MSCRLWMMVIFIIFQMKSKVLTFNHITDCFYEKRNHTALQGYNDIYDRWTSDYDCFDRCLRFDQPKCRSFEYWHREQNGLCIRANISLTDSPSIIGHSSFVDYYEINCRKDSKVVRPGTIHCPGDQLFVTVQLNGIESDRIFLGDNGCKPRWSNETYVQFHTQIDHCSVILTNGSIIGKLRWQNVQNKSTKYYERFFTCPSNVYHVRAMQRTSTSRSTMSNPDEQKTTSSYKITIKWTLHNRSYSCPETCLISLYSFVNVTLDDLSLIASKFSVDSCELQALSPYTNYFQSKQLISHGCSIDPIVIDVPNYSSQLSKFQFSFYLYHILKEPIPFQIQCKILHHEKYHIQSNIDCSTLSLIDYNHSDYFLVNRNDKRDYSYTLFRSSSVNVSRQLSSVGSVREGFYKQDTMISIATVHYFECSLYAFFVLILYAV